MSIETGLRTELVNNAGVAALVGDRIYREFGKQADTYPLLVFSRTGMTTGQILDGVDTYRRLLFRVECLAQTVTTGDNLAAAVRSALDGKRGTLGGVPIEFCYCDGQQDFSELEGDAVTRRISLTFIVICHEG